MGILAKHNYEILYQMKIPVIMLGKYFSTSQNIKLLDKILAKKIIFLMILQTTV